MKARLAAVLCLLMTSFAMKASIDAYPFPNEELAVRYDALIAELRCPQCLNTNLAGSDAMIAQDLRREVHRMLLDGRSDDEILDFMHERYGDFILSIRKSVARLSYSGLARLYCCCWRALSCIA